MKPDGWVRYKDNGASRFIEGAEMPEPRIYGSGWIALYRAPPQIVADSLAGIERKVNEEGIDDRGARGTDLDFIADCVSNIRTALGIVK